MTREEIKSARKLRKLTQAALGELCGLNASEISRIECGYRTMTEVESAALASALGIAPQIGRGLAKAPEAVVETAAASAPVPVKKNPEPVVAPVAVAAAAKPAPTGSDLNDAANFGVLPDLEILKAGSLDVPGVRARLAAEIAKAGTILHTPRVPAAVWRAWRQFEQQASALMRGGAAAPAAAVEPTPAPAPAPVVKAPVPARETVQAAAPVTAASTESKSLSSLFVEVARERLPAEVVARLNSAAEAARQTDTSMGFMKHFRRIAEGELDAATLMKVTDEATQRLASPDRSRSRRGRGNNSAAVK